MLATRSPHRPNPIGLSALRVERIDMDKGIVWVRGLDLLHNTPILDIKPYVPYCDAFPNARAGWLEEVGKMDGPDRLSYDFRINPRLAPLQPRKLQILAVAFAGIVLFRIFRYKPWGF